MVRAISHHTFSSSVWGDGEIRRLYDELMEIDASMARILVSRGDARA
jgi:hypothetical protein